MSINKASLLNEIREAVAKKKTETGERNAVVRVLAKHGAYKTPKIETGRFGKGSSLRIYIWDTKWGTLVLSSGPSVEGEVQYADKRQLKDAPEGSYHVLEKATGTSKITNAMKKIAAREEVTGSTTVSKPKRKKAAPKKAAAKKSFEAEAKKEQKQVKHLIETLGDTYWNVRQGDPANLLDVPARLDELAKLLGSEAYISLTPRRTQVENNNAYESFVRELPQIRSIAEAARIERRVETAAIFAKAKKDAEDAAETKAYSLVKDFKERGSTGFLKDVLKMYHDDDPYESRAARSAINDFAQYAVPGVRIQESMDVFAHAAEGKLNDEKIASYYIENRADVNQITDNQILRLVEGEPEVDDAPDNRLLAVAERAYLDDAVEDYYQAMKTRHGDEALFLGHTNDDPAGFERAIKTKLSQDDLESDNTRSLGRRFYGLVKDREVSELFAELSGLLDEEKLTNRNILDAEVHVERLNEIFGDANFQGNSVKGSMYGRLEAAEQRLAERKAEKEGAVVVEAETMSEADEVAEMMQQLQAMIAARK